MEVYFIFERHNFANRLNHLSGIETPWLDLQLKDDGIRTALKE